MASAILRDTGRASPRDGGAGRVCFGGVTVDFDERRVWGAEGEIRLAVRPFELLKLLVEQRPRLLTKDEIFGRLWPGTFVGDNALATLIAELRQVLDDRGGEARCIRTVYGHGYAFVAEVIHVSPPVTPAVGWTLVREHRPITLREGDNILGRRGERVIALNASTVSRRHARLTIAGARAMIEDLDSKNGTWVGRTRVTGPTTVRDGDQIRLGSLVLTLNAPRDPASTERLE